MTITSQPETEEVRGVPVPVHEAFGNDTKPLTSYFRTSELGAKESFRVISVDFVTAEEYKGKFDPPANRKAWNVLTCQRPDGSVFRIDCVKGTLDKIFRQAFKEIGISKDSVDPIPKEEHTQVDWEIEVVFASSMSPPRAASLKLTARTPGGRTGIWTI